MFNKSDTELTVFEKQEKLRKRLTGYVSRDYYYLIEGFNNPNNNQMFFIPNSFPKKYKMDILKFIGTVCYEKDINYNLFYNNIKTLSIKERSVFDRCKDYIAKEENKCDYSGRYSVRENRILLNLDQSLTHELFHAASSFVDHNGPHSGFIQKKIGVGLTEGFTTLYDVRYFNRDDYNPFYLLLSNFARIIEIIVGERKVKELYFSSDLKGLVDEISKYCDSKIVIDTISMMDTIKLYCKHYYMYTANEKECNTFIKYIYKRLYYMYLKKKQICGFGDVESHKDDMEVASLMIFNDVNPLKFEDVERLVKIKK